jgi:hypothetical protein
VKNRLFIVVLAVAAAVGGYAIYYRAATAPAASMLSNPEGEMEWLKREYHLSDAQFARIQRLHREYTPTCDLMCEKIVKANAKLDKLINANRTFAPEVDGALSEFVAVQSECRRALLGHVYAVSAEMSPEDGARYVEMMKARIVEPALGHQTVISESAKWR